MRGTSRQIYIGIVTDNQDPEKRGRVKAQVDSLTPAGTDYPDWIDATFPYIATDGQNGTGGWHFVPDIGTVIEIEIASSYSGDKISSGVSFDSPDIRWRACLNMPNDKIGSEFQDNYPYRKGIQTSLGHAIVFDDIDNGTDFVKLKRYNDDQLLLDSSGALLEVGESRRILEKASNIILESRNIQFGSGNATDFIVLATKILARLSIIENNLILTSTHTHLAFGVPTTTMAPTFFQTLSTLADIQSTTTKSE